MDKITQFKSDFKLIAQYFRTKRLNKKYTGSKVDLSSIITDMSHVKLRLSIIFNQSFIELPWTVVIVFNALQKHCHKMRQNKFVF